MNDNRAAILVLALVIAALVLTLCSQWHVATDALWVLAAVQHFRLLRFVERRR